MVSDFKTFAHKGSKIAAEKKFIFLAMGKKKYNVQCSGQCTIQCTVHYSVCLNFSVR